MPQAVDHGVLAITRIGVSVLVIDYSILNFNTRCQPSSNTIYSFSNFLVTANG
jgi:hypothetical protein